jgi:hypothetical protein
MKRFILTMFLAVGSLAVFSATGNAQVNRRYSANIPFDFSVGKKEFKAGDYTIGPLGTVTNSDFLVLTDRSTGKAQLIGQVSVNKYQPQLEGKMNFVQSGDAWVLSSIETGTFSVALHVTDRGDTKIASNHRGSSSSKSIAIQ